jgi:hypothetical protein
MPASGGKRIRPIIGVISGEKLAANSEMSSETYISGSGQSNVMMADWRMSSEVILFCSCHCMKICDLSV